MENFKHMPVMAVVRVPYFSRDGGVWRLYNDSFNFVITRQQDLSGGRELLYMKTSQHEDNVGLLGTWVTITQTHKDSAVIPVPRGDNDE